MSEAVLAFESNMCLARLRDYGVAPEQPGVPAYLPGYRLCFNKRSQDDSGKANLEQDPVGKVWGVLYSIPDAHLTVLDKGEGPGYSCQPRCVTTMDGGTSKAWVYVATNPEADHALRPYTWYKCFLVEGALEHHLPADYIKLLEAVESVEDPDVARDRQKRSLLCEGSDNSR